MVNTLFIYSPLKTYNPTNCSFDNNEKGFLLYLSTKTKIRPSSGFSEAFEEITFLVIKVQYETLFFRNGFQFDQMELPNFQKLASTTK